MHTSPAASAGYCAPPDRWVRLVNGQRRRNRSASQELRTISNVYAIYPQPDIRAYVARNLYVRACATIRL